MNREEVASVIPELERLLQPLKAKVDELCILTRGDQPDNTTREFMKVISDLQPRLLHGQQLLAEAKGRLARELTKTDSAAEAA